jgi:hypothetical protein
MSALDLRSRPTLPVLQGKRAAHNSAKSPVAAVRNRKSRLVVMLLLVSTLAMRSVEVYSNPEVEYFGHRPRVSI